MNPFQYVVVNSTDEAMPLLGKNGRYLAGGIDLLDEMKAYIVSPDILVKVQPQLARDGINRTTEHAVPSSPVPIWRIVKQFPDSKIVRLDSQFTVADIAGMDILKPSMSAIMEAASEVGSPQIRNVATLGGNVLQHSRCWYYRQPDITCLKRGGTLCYAQEGENKYSSLFSGCSCISPVTSNLGVALTALNAVAEVKHGGVGQNLSMTDLYKEAWTNPAAHHSVSREDFLLGFDIPHRPNVRSAYRQVSEKSEFDWALVSCAAAGNVTNGTITDARVVLGAVAPVPYMVEEANKFLEGKLLTDETASKAADIILKDAKPLAQNGYKVPLAHTLIRRTLLALNP